MFRVTAIVFLHRLLSGKRRFPAYLADTHRNGHSDRAADYHRARLSAQTDVWTAAGSMQGYLWYFDHDWSRINVSCLS